MTSRPYHTIYEDCLIHLHYGFPLWVADPGLEEEIQIGDIGYYELGGFETLKYVLTLSHPGMVNSILCFICHSRIYVANPMKSAADFNPSLSQW
jgi:hypothetical protein